MIIQERLFPKISDFVYTIILSLTTKNNKANALTKWVCTQYLNNHFKSLDDGVIDGVAELIKAYNKNKTKLKPIMDYKDPEELEDDIVKNSTGNKTKSEFEAEARKGTKQIYKDKEFIVLKIETWAAAKKYGAGTRWCISTRYDDETFLHYQQKSDNQVYFIIDRVNKEYKYACVGNICYDEYDDILFVVDEEKDIRDKHSMPDELETRISENENLINVFPYAFPEYNKDFVIQVIKETCNI